MTSITAVGGDHAAVCVKKTWTGSSDVKHDMDFMSWTGHSVSEAAGDIQTRFVRNK